MSDTDPKKRKAAEARRKPATDAHHARTQQASCAQRWVEKRRANRPDRPSIRLPAYAVPA